jgi:hypothetical protein
MLYIDSISLAFLMKDNRLNVTYFKNQYHSSSACPFAITPPRGFSTLPTIPFSLHLIKEFISQTSKKYTYQIMKST